ncbi:pyridoxamine 5'-phosphate oxidase family protein [Streptomyces sp. NBC_00015]|uniref:pyridoxamine 5'-phosphate oxidase family protein n=1 Tax=unclassified Streptomyces TaxID=2593676 RepID=UPI0022513EB9|nr:pyridoxamine 5'-phosphate oxidase family protein [Streptomyces sp. NBC_00103]MCX5373737.1 pyridoxamine 5'-phosphate oxidase family protein [Streptomyces sp. NBC_00103]
MTPAPARPAKQRRIDTLHRLEHDVDAWVATAAEGGSAPYLVPLSFVWDGATLLFATPATSPTGRNLLATGAARIAVGPTQDVVMIEGTAVAVPPLELPEEDAEIFAGKTGFDPRELAAPYLYFRVLPARIQAWRAANEIQGRELMRDGTWLVAD